MGRTTWVGPRGAVVGALAAVAICGGSGLATAQQVEARQQLRRDLREYLFLSSQLGFRHRAPVYAEDAVQGPAGRSELRFHLNGRYQGSAQGGLGAYVGLGVVARFPRGDGIADPLLSPYDEFEALQNIRVFGAHVQYTLQDEEGQSRLVAQAGRLSDFDDRARLLMYDGARVEVRLGRRWGLGVYGGRRAVLDGNFSDDRTGAGAQLVSGVFARGRFDTLSVQLSHRFEEVQQAGLRIGWDPTRDVGLALSSQVVFGDDEARLNDDAITGLTSSDLPVALLVRLDGDYASPSGRTAVYLVSEVQLGVDPRVYGRSGRGPSTSEVDAALRTTMNQARLDRLFMGPGQPHVLAEIGAEQWLHPMFGLRAGGVARLPLGDAAQRSLQPRLLEGWFGPELATSKGDRVAVELRVASEDPGTPDLIFAAQGDGERFFGVLRAFAEVPFRLSSDWAVALRPEFEATIWDNEGPLATSENQLGLFGGLLTSVKAGPDFRGAVRYGLGTQPSFSSAGVDLVHDVEVWLGGAF